MSDLPLCFFDFETRGPVPIRHGTYKYAEAADAILLAYAIGDEPVQVVECIYPHDCEESRILPLTWHNIPSPFAVHFLNGGRFVAWNAGFDRAIWNYALGWSPWMAPGRVLDAMAQSLANNLPASLDEASAALGGPGKDPAGSKLIERFSVRGEDRPAADPAAWEQFKVYAARDVEVLRQVWRATRPLTEAEWRVYAANEAVNDRGIGVDLSFATAAARLARQDAQRTGARLSVLTAGIVTSVFQHERIARWVYERLTSAEAREIMTTAFLDEETAAEVSSDEALKQEIGLTITRGTVERLLDCLRRTGCDDAVLMEVLELREFGAGAAPKKFQAILDQNVRGRLYGQLVFDGAGMTGRFSGKGVQPQNLTRAVLGRDPQDDTGYWEPLTVDLISGGCTLEELAAHGAGEVPARKLALTVRPAIIAPEGLTLVKADFAQIEARVLPWLAASEEAKPLLEAFRRIDHDPSAPDLYKVTAAGMLRKSVEDISKEERQTGKVAILACGFGGGRNALQSMAASYRLWFSDEQAQGIVDQWRAANAWAPVFWGRHSESTGESFGLFGAAMRAVTSPRTVHRAGRVLYVFDSAYLKGTLFCILPSKRLLTYPGCKMREYDVKDRRTKQVIETRFGLTFRRAHGISPLYGGRLAENVTQAVAADLLREALVELDSCRSLAVIMHAHDEIVAEVDEDLVELASDSLTFAMTDLSIHPWAAGLPLAVDVTERFYYSSAKEAA